MLLGRSNALEIALALLVIGGHSVATALIEKQTKTAILEALAVAACVAIFVSLHALVKRIAKSEEKAKHPAKAVKRRRKKRPALSKN